MSKPRKLSPIGRVSYANVFEAKQINGEGDPLFTMDLIFEKDAPGMKEFIAEVEANAKEKWPKGVPKNWQSPFKDGDSDEKAESPEYHGRLYISVKAKEDRQPTVVDRDKSLITKQSGHFYGGCFARISYNIYSWEKLKKHGTSIGLNNIQKVGDGPHLGGGRTTAEEDFDEFTEEIPFDGADSSNDDNDMPF